MYSRRMPGLESVFEFSDCLTKLPQLRTCAVLLLRGVLLYISKRPDRSDSGPSCISELMTAPRCYPDIDLQEIGLDSLWIISQSSPYPNNACKRFPCVHTESISGRRAGTCTQASALSILRRHTPGCCMNSTLRLRHGDQRSIPKPGIQQNILQLPHLRPRPAGRLAAFIPRRKLVLLVSDAICTLEH
ncbi:hypothetical protein HBI73_141090 [Parastagonospora nodorum]|nr:hypothetical protein HBH42_011910 [Parastagonospora nodorum]KAH5087994.1 hypothetical protein HBI73_141090 [Parastagonospora nodorum]KAH5187176.1 hypothetical protein HBH76_112600 [Parastagonospora nodorum]KAH5603289.1 hypothetical protein HBI45_117720 [Parastagonospora nodorum]KAH6014907.1 hypothetical protein HBI82_117170 [Parastagonospora nodorum]